MFADENETIKRLCADSLAAAMAAAQQALEAAEAAEFVALAELAVQGRQVVRWSPPGTRGLVCPHCGRVDEWYQSVTTGAVRCRCALD